MEKTSLSGATNIAEDVGKVDKAKYQQWEQQVISTFFDKEHKVTDLVPTDGRPSFSAKDKVVLAAFEKAAFPNQIKSG